MADNRDDLVVKTRSFANCLEYFVGHCMMERFPYEENSLEEQVFAKIVDAFALQKAAYDCIFNVQLVEAEGSNGHLRLVGEIFGIETEKLFGISRFESALDVELKLLLNSADFNLNTKADCVKAIWPRLVKSLLSGMHVYATTAEDEAKIDELLKALKVDAQELVLRLAFNLDGKGQTRNFQKLADLTGLPMTAAQFRQIRDKALRRMRHPSFSRHLKHIVSSVHERLEDSSRLMVELLQENKSISAVIVQYENDAESTPLVQKLRKQLEDLRVENGKLILGSDPRFDPSSFPESMANLNLPIEQLGLSTRAYNGLRNCDLWTVKDICKRTERDLTHTKNFGKKSVQEIKDVLTRFGFSLKEDF